MSVVDNYLKEHGFIIPGNEIYGGYRGLYDYGHIGVLLKKNIQRLWENFFVFQHDNVYFIEGTILGSEMCWKASGHLDNFHDILVDCMECKKRYREDHLKDNTCPNCGGKKWTTPKEFNLIFKTEGESLYLRPETAQSIFINFRNVQRFTPSKIPFAIAQVGKAFRNEITMHNSIFRTLEFEQMECEWFVKKTDSNICFQKCLEQMQTFLIDVIGLKKEKVKLLEIPEQDRAHYSKRSTDIQFEYETGWGELWGLANRGNFDLTAHQNASKKSLEYQEQCDDSKVCKFLPEVIEHSIGLNRLMYALITSALEVQEPRTVLKIKESLAPYKFAILPLTKSELNIANKIYSNFLQEGISILMLKKGSIGKRYKKNDEIGTPYCITIDQGSKLDANNPSFTIRDRDTMKQIDSSWDQLKKDNFKVTFE
ncbi:glycine--tRNA ligase [Candidatus Mycoplasma haematohominis]|uniref:glycine--tRNA ligase n=1 Tax=Candidatus Mycoplasma haematohominis TaxID=1494318 RepID=UPI001C0A765A|nr:glycine--tRNA ligase [Candidatus Mycoplasma haemohominis]